MQAGGNGVGFQLCSFGDGTPPKERLCEMTWRVLFGGLFHPSSPQVEVLSPRQDSCCGKEGQTLVHGHETFPTRFGSSFSLGRGSCGSAKNPFHCLEVILNSPGMNPCDPTIPHACKWNAYVRRIVGETVVFVDDMRACGFSKENAWQIVRRLTSILQCLGIQDAPRKRCVSCQSPGSWIGCIDKVTPEMVAQTVSQEKWEKGQGVVFALAEPGLPECAGSPKLAPCTIGKDRGFLTHPAMTFPALVPLLKGFHLTLDQERNVASFRSNHFVADGAGNCQNHETRVLPFLICMTLRAESLSAPPFVELKSMPP
jgi:hypothetical protein